MADLKAFAEQLGTGQPGQFPGQVWLHTVIHC